ncbi:MAG TPA: isocitrate/isopropylmalate family dehydrogenase [Alphaproteobacteria bacterium]|nr:isocitrate/isopropylmalate family dehydrogenase [Alphaproteobacteria bacterium]
MRYSFDRPDDAERIDRAVEAVLNAGLRTGDIMQEGKTRVSTSRMGDAILRELERLN